MNTNTPLSPKVLAAGLSGLIATLLLSFVSAVTPDMFDGLGKWGPVIYGLVIVGATFIAGWLKTDPLRLLPQDQTPTAPAPAADSVTVNATATAAEPAAPATTFTATQARIDALPDAPAPVAAAPAVVAPIIPN